MIVFARTRWQYDSYGDFWELVRLSGFPVVWLDEIDLAADVTYVFTPHNGEFNQLVGMPVEPPAPGQNWHPATFRPGWHDRRCRIVWWMLERPDGNRVAFGDAVENMRGLVDACWVSDRWVATLHPALTHVVLGGHPGLRYESTATDGPPYDYAHLSYAWGRRESLYAALRGRGLREAPSGYGQLRSLILRSTKLVVSAHQYPAATIAPLRFAIAAAHGLPVLTEQVNDPHPHVLAEDLEQAAYADLPAAAVSLLQDPERLARVGAALRRRLCEEWTFRRGVEEAVAAMRTR